MGSMTENQPTFIEGELEDIAAIQQPAHRVTFSGLGPAGWGAVTLEWETVPGELITALAVTTAASLVHKCNKETPP